MEYNQSLVSESYDGRVGAEIRRLRSMKGAFYLAGHFAHLHDLELDGLRVLEIGAGTGHFTEYLLDSGACVEVTDLSPVQLRANMRRMSDLGLDICRANWTVQDAADLSFFDTNSFDVVVCFGGILNLLLEKVDEALDEMFRVTKPNGYIVVSFMTLLGTIKAWPSKVVELLRSRGAAHCSNVIRDRIVMPATSGLPYPTRLYMVEEVLDMSKVRGGRTVKISGTEFLLNGLGEQTMSDIMHDPGTVSEVIAFDRLLLSMPSALQSSPNVVLTIQCGETHVHR